MSTQADTSKHLLYVITHMYHECRFFLILFLYQILFIGCSIIVLLIDLQLLTLIYFLLAAIISSEMFALQNRGRGQKQDSVNVYFTFNNELL